MSRRGDESQWKMLSMCEFVGSSERVVYMFEWANFTAMCASGVREVRHAITGSGCDIYKFLTGIMFNDL